ncbi:MAG: insulinase family protein [Oscillospiraceae bacterium]|nr:insulinase family protein [Oscillospiraceae bacterium]
MQANDIIHGFTVRYTQSLPEIGATLVRMSHPKSGADLVWLDRRDDNKTFAITFKTIPQDDTGVFHILEHSVLSGSRKYPVKEPFVELLKSSMNTFLNAFTFPDKTMYPVCSRNDQDFLNLMDVYMDAVLHPLSISNPQAFLQEGWHYELEAPDGELAINGVVYNEMKGSFASSDTVLDAEMNRLLFPDNCYGWESGGHPDHIPELTYEHYLASHARFYHPSNARIFLDGSIDTDAVLARLDGFLSEFDAIDVHADIPLQAPVAPAERTVFYEIGPEDDESRRVILSKGFGFARFDEPEKLLAFSALSDVLCSSNDSPLKKAVLEAGLADDVSLSLMDGVQQSYISLIVRNAAEADEDAIWAALRDAVEEQVKNGIDRAQLRAVLDRLEFSARAKDFGSTPRGLVYGMLAQQSWLYGGDPAQDLRSFSLFAPLRDRLETDYFEALLREALLDNPHRATLKMLPSKTLGEEKQAAERARLRALKERWSAQEVEAVIDGFRAFRAAQEAPDAPEQLSTLPRLSLADIPEEIPPVAQSVSTLEGVTLLHQVLETDGILYLDLYFSQRDVPEEQLSLLSLLASLYSDVDTENHSALDLSAEIDRTLGGFSVAPMVVGRRETPEVCDPYLVVRLALLESKKAQALALIDEILNASRFTDAVQIGNLVRQQRVELEQQITMSGNAFASQRLSARCCAAGAVSERLSGITLLRALQGWDKSLPDGGEALCQALTALSAGRFSRARLTVSLTGAMDEGWLRQVIARFPDTPMGEAADYTLFPQENEGFLIPAEIGFAAKVSHLSRTEGVSAGALKVAAQFLTYDYLWSEVRVKGGAYGTGCGTSASGSVSFTSYRDPSPARSLSVYDGAGDALRALCRADEAERTKYIVSTIAGEEPVRTPRLEGSYAATLYLLGETAEKRQKKHSEMLHTSPDDLLRVADALDVLTAGAGICVIGGKETLDACGDALARVEAIQA